MSRFPPLMRGSLPSWTSRGKDPIKKRSMKRFLTALSVGILGRFRSDAKSGMHKGTTTVSTSTSMCSWLCRTSSDHAFFLLVVASAVLSPAQVRDSMRQESKGNFGHLGHANPGNGLLRTLCGFQKVLRRPVWGFRAQGAQNRSSCRVYCRAPWTHKALSGLLRTSETAR